MKGFVFKDKIKPGLNCINVELQIGEDCTFVVADNNLLVKLIVNNLGEIAICGPDEKVYAVMKKCLANTGWKLI